MIKFTNLIKESEKLKDQLIEGPDDDDAGLNDVELDEPDNEDTEEENIDTVAPDGKGEYDADDLREVIDYVYDILDKEDDGEDNDSVEEIGLDLIYEYADVMPDTLINQLVDDLKEMFEIEDTMLESAMFVKSKKGAAAQSAKKRMLQFYKKNKKSVKSRAKTWRTSPIGKKLAKLHKTFFKGCTKSKCKRLHVPDGMPKQV